MRSRWRTYGVSVCGTNSRPAVLFLPLFSLNKRQTHEWRKKNNRMNKKCRLLFCWLHSLGWCDDDEISVARYSWMQFIAGSFFLTFHSHPQQFTHNIEMILKGELFSIVCAFEDFPFGHSQFSFFPLLSLFILCSTCFVSMSSTLFSWPFVPSILNWCSDKTTTIWSHFGRFFGSRGRWWCWHVCLLSLC